MAKVLVINGAQEMGISKAQFNKTIAEVSVEELQAKGHELQLTEIDTAYSVEDELAKFVWAEVVVYHTPIWWFHIPYKFKEYIDLVFSAGKDKGIYKHDGRTSSNPKLGYGTGGMMQGKQYILTTSWNAPETAFNTEGELFEQTPVDDGVMFGFHKMNSFIGMKNLGNFHFHDVAKNPQISKAKDEYASFLKSLDF